MASAFPQSDRLTWDVAVDHEADDLVVLEYWEGEDRSRRGGIPLGPREDVAERLEAIAQRLRGG